MFSVTVETGKLLWLDLFLFFCKSFICKSLWQEEHLCVDFEDLRVEIFYFNVSF